MKIYLKGDNYETNKTVRRRRVLTPAPGTIGKSAV